MKRLVNAAQMRTLDEQTIQGLGVPGLVLMESAGRGVVEALWALHGRGEIDLRAGRALVVAGPGNNGADGLVVARYLHSAGVAVQVLLCAERSQLRGDALAQIRMAEACGVVVVAAVGDGTAGATTWLGGLGPRDVIVDSLLGIGLTRAVTGPLARVIAAMNASPAVRVAVDVPSGLDANRGEPSPVATEALPAPAIVRAAYTVTFAWAKLGLVSAPGYRYAGRVSVVDIGIPPGLAPLLGVRSWLLSPALLQPLWTPRDPDGHKGSHGHLLIIAGSEGKTGAALLCARGAQGAGVGLCTVAAPPGAQEALQARVLEAMTLRYPTPAAGAEALASAWLAASVGKRAVAIGPGLPGGDAVAQALRRLLAEGDVSLVLDADALNLLAGDLTPLRQATARGRTVVITPHPGEAARLLGCSAQAVQADRLAATRRLCHETGAVVLLKGARTVLAAPLGATETAANGDAPPGLADSEALYLCPTGNAGMGCGGMGDVLTGMIGALLASGLSHDSQETGDALGAGVWAACAAAYWHGLAGDCLLARSFPAALLQAGALCDALPEAVLAARLLHQAERDAASCHALHQPLLPEASLAPRPRLH